MRISYETDFGLFVWVALMIDKQVSKFVFVDRVDSLAAMRSWHFLALDANFIVWITKIRPFPDVLFSRDEVSDPSHDFCDLPIL